MIREATTEIEINDEPVEVEVRYDYEPPCGDGFNEPRYGADVHIVSVKDASGNEVEYTKDHEAYLIDYILDELDRQAAEYEQDKAEYFYEAALERGYRAKCRTCGKMMDDDREYCEGCWDILLDDLVNAKANLDRLQRNFYRATGRYWVPNGRYKHY